MKAIVTKFHGPTDFKGSRYSASAEGVSRVILQTDYALSSDKNHERAALALANKYGWLKDGTRLVGGGLPDGRMAGWRGCLCGLILTRSRTWYRSKTFSRTAPGAGLSWERFPLRWTRPKPR